MRRDVRAKWRAVSSNAMVGARLKVGTKLDEKWWFELG